jgi:hypothetical protein
MPVAGMWISVEGAAQIKEPWSDWGPTKALCTHAHVRQQNERKARWLPNSEGPAIDYHDATVKERPLRVRG